MNIPHKNLMANTIAIEILESRIKIPSLPAYAQQIMSIAQNSFDKIDIKELEKLIQKDPVLFAQILKLANSSYYGAGRKIVGLHDAIISIGLADTVSSLYLYLFKNALPAFPEIKGVSDKDYWDESWACAIANRRLGDSRLMVDSLPGDLYIAGLLHGIGKLILAAYDPKSFYECIKLARTSDKSFEDAELDIFGTTDSLIAYKILASWNIPSNICAAVGYYQYPESAEPQYQEIASLTQFACSVVKIAKSLEKEELSRSSFNDIDISMLDNTYIAQKKDSPLSDKAQQLKIVKEIIEILNKHSVNAKSEEEIHKSNKTILLNDEAKPASVSSDSPKKGLFSWLRLLFKGGKSI